MLSIRKFAIIPSLLLILTSCSGQEERQQPQYRIESGHDLSILTTTDTHYLAQSLRDFGPAFNQFLAAGDGKQLGYSREMMDALGYDIGIRRPDAVIISGDLTNNGEQASHKDLAKHLQQIEQDTGTRVYVIPGNHDIQNPWARRFDGSRQYTADSVTAEEFRTIYNNFGYSEALLEDGDSLSYLAAPSEDLWLLMLDTAKYGDNKKLGHPQLEGGVSSATLKWIRACGELAAANGAHIVAVMHHSLLDHSEFIQEGFTVDDHGQVIDTLLQSGIRTVFSGHIHIQDISQYQEENGNRIYDIAGSALSVFPHQYGLLKYSSANQTMDYSTAALGMEAWAAATGSTDENLLGFKKYSEANFRKRSATRSYSRLSADPAYAGYSDAELMAMADVVGRLNEIYFAGTARTDNAAVIATEGYRLWQSAPSGGLRSYVLGMTSREVKDNQQLHVELQGP
ncbi:metallophosphoesterase [Paenibacillus sp. MMS20-IR301]|uniref:metallophosphoesterase n=1 Tax=Paenibacillus sp. MMS20-IR301 TaxID=2895946 RepID=UPI0028EFEF81|nr:metallophosphoesterase [Paenibacillus sp. MMS20-IR301]WNS44256.1 metallophosphoesterase [Paenibacillus sp. MMS20-IR301]